MANADLAQLTEWSARWVGSSAKVVSMVPLRPEVPRWLLEIIGGGTTTHLILKSGSPDMREELATEAAALSLAEAHSLPTPRLVAADIDGRDAGYPAVLMTYIDGSDQLPQAAARERFRALGAAAATFHRVLLTPTEALPLRHRHMPWVDFSAERREGKRVTTALLDRADRLIAERPAPKTDATVFLHGDLWAGNTLWRDGTCVAVIDWEAAGAGNCGVDVGSLRLDAALTYGPEAGDEIIVGWQAAVGHQMENLAYWDVVAALNTSADMAGDAPSFHAAGRRDLDGPTLTARRDEFQPSNTSADHTAPRLEEEPERRRCRHRPDNVATAPTRRSVGLEIDERPDSVASQREGPHLMMLRAKLSATWLGNDCSTSDAHLAATPFRPLGCRN